MKSLYLIINRLKQYFVKSRAVFIVFLVGSIFSALMIIYFYGNVIPQKPDHTFPEYRYRQYDLHFSTSMFKSEDIDGNVFQELGQYNGELNNKKLIESILVVHQLSFFVDPEICLTACVFGDANIQAYEGSDTFTGKYQLIEGC